MQPTRIVTALPAAGSAGRDAWPASDWWREFADPQLDALMARALTQSPTLAVAQARLAQARAAAGISSAASALQVNADLSINHGRQSENYMIPKPPLGVGGEFTSIGQAGISLGFDLDFWGRNAALIRAAQDQVDAAEFDHAGARLALTTSIARLYGVLASQYEQLDILSAMRAQRQALVELSRQRASAGLDTQIESRQAETGVAALQGEIVQLQTAMALTRLQLATLTGATPGAADDLAAGSVRPRLQTPPFNLPASLPLDLLARRPEIAAQRLRIAAAGEAMTAAEADFYPNINLAALVGYQAIGLNKLFDAGSATTSLGPALHLPIYGGGRLKANYALRSADREQAVAHYNQALLSAVQDVVEQVTRAAAYTREEGAVNAALQAAREALRIGQLRYREGLMNRLGLLALEGQLLAQQRVVADLQARRLDLQITLVRALGGGFSTPGAAPNVAEEP